jgi:RNA polymerase sigma factor (sigma-70 family)
MPGVSCSFTGVPQHVDITAIASGERSPRDGAMAEEEKLKRDDSTDVSAMANGDRGSGMDPKGQPRSDGDGDHAVLMEAIMTEHESGLLRYATRLLNNPDTAQDVVQNVFIKLYRNWPEGMKPSPKLKSWLYSVTHNEAVDTIRRESRLRLLHEKQAGDPALAPVCADGVHCSASSEDERRTIVMEHLRKLHPRQQQVLLLRLDEGLSYSEISAATGRTEGNVGNLLHHAVKDLAARLKRAGVVTP